MIRPPCQADRELTGREWANEAPPLKAREIREMAEKCKSCPLRVACRAIAEEDPVVTVGVWGGLYYKRQVREPVDPLDESPERRSVYDSLSWEGRRQAWKAFAQIDGRFYHIGQHRDEERAYAMVLHWWRDREADSR